MASGARRELRERYRMSSESSALSIRDAMANLRKVLQEYVYRCRSEAELQAQVVHVISQRLSAWHVDTEVRQGAGRFDIALNGPWSSGNYDPARPRGLLVLELKVKSSAAKVEAQAQRYALMPEVSAVVVVTTSSRLASQLSDAETMGGKPFGVVALRSS